MGSNGRVVVLGAGSSGEHFVGALRRLDPDVDITVVERALAGGECSYYACIPTKTLLRPTEALAAARLAPGAAEALTGDLDPERVFWWRDEVTDRRNDAWHEGWLQEQRAELVRGEARVLRPGVVAVDDREIAYGSLVVATGSSPAVPPIEGLDQVEYWTNREAVWAGEIPESLAVLGGGPVGVELAQFFHRMGAKVTILEKYDRILSKVDREAGMLLGQRFQEEGIDIRTEVEVERVEAGQSGLRMQLTSGEALDAERLLVAIGRRPNVEGFGLEELDVEINPNGLTVDARLRAGDAVWAIGDVAGVGLLTHLGKYQARVAAANVAGQDAEADYRAIPASVFTDPQVGTVGTTERDDLVTFSYPIVGGRLSTYERPKRQGLVKLAADRERRVLVGALTVGPEAGEWLGQLTLAVRAEVPVDVLLDTIQPYPTFSEAIFEALRGLGERLREAAPEAA